MFYPFKPGRNQRPPEQHVAKLQAKINAIQRDWAGRLDARARKLPTKRLKIMLVITGVLACSAAGFLIYRGISPSKITVHRFDLNLPAMFESISVPESVTKQYALDRYLDSLEKAFISDSIQHAKSKLSHDTSGLH